MQAKKWTCGNFRNWLAILCLAKPTGEDSPYVCLSRDWESCLWLWGKANTPISYGYVFRQTKGSKLVLKSRPLSPLCGAVQQTWKMKMSWELELFKESFYSHHFQSLIWWFSIIDLENLTLGCFICNLYLSELAFINQFYSRITRLVQLSLAND